MKNIDYEYLESEYENFPTRERTRCNVERVVGSLTDNLRIAKVNRDGARKRLRELKEASR